MQELVTVTCETTPSKASGVDNFLIEVQVTVDFSDFPENASMF